MLRILGRVLCVLAGTVLLVSGVCDTATATPGDTTWVRTFDHRFYNWASAEVDTFTFPTLSLYRFNKIVLFYRIECPPAPGDCDPWDRLGYVQVLREITGKDLPDGRTIEPVEIARVVTPYDITGTGRPGHCVWQLDVTDYESLLHDQVVLSNYIESWIGGNKGWIVTIDFAFIEGIPTRKAYQVVNLWQSYYTVYGDPARPIESVLAPRSVEIDPAANAVKVRAITTGHGQGNTMNCAEFCSRLHTISANGNKVSHSLWRADCSTNTCSPQGGTWTYPRAGWCPGDKVTPWDVDVTSFVTPGSPAILDYDVQPYENLCRPDNPDCIPGTTCDDCNYNYNGHTEPFYAIQAQLISYRAVSSADLSENVLSDGAGGVLDLAQNAPNPFAGSTSIVYTLSAGAVVQITIYDAGGRIVRRIARTHDSPGTFRVRWDGRNDAGEAVSAGCYFCRLSSGDQEKTRHIILVR
jgi:hypothetical protein